MNQFNNNPLSNIPGVVKNLLILNVVVYIALNVLFTEYFNLFALHFVFSDQFQPFQWFSHMFMHGGIPHLFFNMFALWMFGSTIEKVFGPKRFLVFYLICGFGAASLYIFTDYLQFLYISKSLIPEQVNAVKHAVTTVSGFEYTYYHGQSKTVIDQLFAIIDNKAVGASGAIFGILVAFGMLFPNTELMLLFFPVPVKAKYFIPGLIIINLFLGVGNFRWDNVAHFAHLGGALFGFIMVKIWSRDKTKFY